MNIDIATRGTSLHVTDVIEQRQCVLRTPTPATAEAVDGDSFYFPVDAAAVLNVGSVTLGNYVPTFVRNGDGDVVAEVDRFDEQTFDDGEFLLELEQPVKLYIRVHGSLRIETTGMTTTIETDGQLWVGARSRHNHPAATITTTGEPEELLEVVSALSSSLKSTSPERAYPTLRGHPPEIEVGEELHIPEGLSSPDSGVHIEVPVQRRFIYPVAPLAFYLGAELVPGTVPRIVGEDGFTYRLDGLVGHGPTASGTEFRDADGFEETVAQTLKQVLLLDCVTRTEGFYGIALAERERVEECVDLDWASLYEGTITEQLRAYLDVPYERIADHVPEWKSTGYIAPTAENAELLPFLLDDLATIQMPAGENVTASEAQTASMFDFARSEGEMTRSTGQRRSESRSKTVESPMTQLVEPEPTDAFQTVWADEGMPIGATKASIAGYRNGLDHTPSEEIGVTVVINDDGMADEGDVAENVYGDDTEFPFDLRVYRNLTTDRLKAVLETKREFLHYVGHIEADGFQCSDGRLDARDLDFVGVDAFFLNGCASYDQGMALLERGAVGGVVTVTEVINSGAARVGEAMVKLLNHGFPLRAALDVASQQSFVGGQYSIVGDGDVDILQRKNLGASVTDITESEGEFVVSPTVYPTGDLSVGAHSRTVFGSGNQYELTPGSLKQIRYESKSELRQVLQQTNDLVRYQGQIYHPDRLPFSESS
ncbi:hypothetical protein [Halolamina sp.]|uniref:hypothetical protein n=1 Tax=Halolamina sp. TaxID=1940283 RepID=UPI003563F12C